LILAKTTPARKVLMSPLDVRIIVRGLRIVEKVAEMTEEGEMHGAAMIGTVAPVKGRRA